MKTGKSILAAVALCATFSLGAPTLAQEPSFRPGTVWETSRIKVMPGQFDAYLDYLAKDWKKIQEFGKAEGAVVSYHVLQTNNRREGEPHLILVVQYKDYATTAQLEAMRAKVNALLAQDDRKRAAGYADRGKMRETLGTTEYQELILK